MFGDVWRKQVAIGLCSATNVQKTAPQIVWDTALQFGFNEVVNEEIFCFLCHFRRTNALLSRPNERSYYHQGHAESEIRRDADDDGD
jgi:hypothetical protein